MRVASGWRRRRRRRRNKEWRVVVSVVMQQWEVGVVMLGRLWVVVDGEIN